MASPPLPVSAQVLPSTADQINAAIPALPKDMRDGAGVMGYRTAGKMEITMIARMTNSKFFFTNG